jgi:hypothetical protein
VGGVGVELTSQKQKALVNVMTLMVSMGTYKISENK